MHIATVSCIEKLVLGLAIAGAHFPLPPPELPSVIVTVKPLPKPATMYALRISFVTSSHGCIALLFQPPLNMSGHTVFEPVPEVGSQTGTTYDQEWMFWLWMLSVPFTTTTSAVAALPLPLPHVNK